MARLFGQCAFALSVLSRMYSARGGDTLRVGPATCEFARTGRSTRRRMHTPQAEPTGNARLARGLPIDTTTYDWITQLHVWYSVPAMSTAWIPNKYIIE